MDRRITTTAALAIVQALAAASHAQQLIAKARPGITPTLDRAPVLAALGVSHIRPALAVQPASDQLARSIGLDRYYALSLQPGIDSAAAAAAIPRMTDLFEHVEEEHTGTIADHFPQDPYFAHQWNLRNIGADPVCDPQIAAPTPVRPVGRDINALAAWQIRTTAPDIRIAVLDSGISPHPDLEPLLPGWSWDGNGTLDGCNHGTHVAGTIGAKANNNVGITGVLWGAKIAPVKVLNGCWGTDVNYAAGIIWSADHAEVSNSSLQYYSVGQIMIDALDYAAAKGLVMVAASGNMAGVVAWPGRHPGVIAVGATTHTDARASFSNTGPEVEMAAPGQMILSLHQNGGYACNSGTSMASPHVAAAAAMLRAEDSRATPARIRQILAAAAEDLGASGRDQEFGWGRLNLGRALHLSRCYADADFSGQIDAADVSEFGARFRAQHTYADIDLSGAFDEADVMGYLELYVRGCKRE